MKKTTKKVTKKTVQPVEEAPQVPTISFTEEEVKKVAEVISFFHDKATFKEMNAPEAKKLWAHLNFMASHCKKIDGYIMEFRQVTKPGA